MNNRYLWGAVCLLLLVVIGLSAFQITSLARLRKSTRQITVELANSRTKATVLEGNIQALAAKADAIERLVTPQPINDAVPQIDRQPYHQPMPIGGVNPFSYKENANCHDVSGSRTMVALVLGQSNAANYGGRMSRSNYGEKVANYFNGFCFVAADPLLGADGDSGSLWPELGNRLIASGQYDRVIIVPFAVGGSPMDRWRAGGDLHIELEKLLLNLAADNIKPTHVFWIQGEAERIPSSIYYNDGDAYRRDLSDLIAATRRAGDSKFFVSLASSCPTPAGKPGYRPNIRQAQIGATDPDKHIYVGADLDGITDYADRFDACHLTASGLSKAIDEMIQAVERADKTSAQ